jgi:hypothetical protein
VSVHPRNVAQLFLVVAMAASCVAPARSQGAYQAKAVDTAEAVVSAARTVLLTARLAADGGSFAATIAVAVADAESDAASARDAFASVQPPDAASDAIRRDVLPVVERAVRVIQSVRIAARRGELDRLPAVARPLDAIATRLDRFSTSGG